MPLLGAGNLACAGTRWAEPSSCLSPELRAEVRHTSKCDEENYLVGCRFSRLLMVEDMMALG